MPFNIVNNASHNELISILECNDHNGVYNDADSIREFGAVAINNELRECAINQELTDDYLNSIK